MEEIKLHTFDTQSKEHLKKFGNRLKNRRKKIGFKSQREFADELNVNLKTVRNWEQGRNIPELITLIDICDMLHCSPDYLLGYIDETTHNMHYISQITGLTEKSIEGIQSLWLGMHGNLHWICDKDFKNVEEIQEYFQKVDGGKYAVENFESEIRKRPAQSTNLLTLNLLLSSEGFKNILGNLYAYLFFQYEPSKDEIKKAQELNSHYGKNYKAIIQGKHGYVDAEYLNASFLVSIQNNCMKLKEELHNSNFNIE